jgi:hypothetical protein
MNAANILCFLSGSLTATVAAVFYAMHIERLHFYNLMAARAAGFNEGKACGIMQPLQPLAPTRIIKRL